MRHGFYCTILVGLAVAAAPLLALCGSAYAQDGSREGICGRMMEGGDGKVTRLDDPSLHILDQTSAPGPFVPGEATLDHTLTSFYCARSDIVPAQNDYKLLKHGYPFFIYSKVGEENRILILEILNGQLRVRFSPGTPLPAETQDRIQKFLDTAQPHFYKDAKD